MRKRVDREALPPQITDRFEPLALDAIAGVNGRVWYESTNHLIRAVINGVITTVGASGGAPPSAHATTHEPGGSDPMAVNAAAGTGSLRTLSTTATSAAAGNHTHTPGAPAAHATTHEPGGSDPMAVDQAAGTASLRSLGATSTTAAAGNHTHATPPQQILDARTAALLLDDFLTGTTSTGNIGLGWGLAIGTVSILDVDDANHPGVIRLSAATTASSHVYSPADPTGTFCLAANFFDVQFWIKLNQVDTNCLVRFGLGIAANTPNQTDGVYFEKLAADTTGGDWHGATIKTAGGNAVTAAVKGVAGAAALDTSWHRFRIRRVDASTVGFSIDDGTEITTTTSVPVTQLNLFMTIQSVTATKTMDCDLVTATLTGITR